MRIYLIDAFGPTPAWTDYRPQAPYYFPDQER